MDLVYLGINILKQNINNKINFIHYIIIINIFFITFGGGDINYFEAVSRICSQAKQLGIFNKIIGYTTIYLVNDKEFCTCI
jgi:hypothetical protein